MTLFSIRHTFRWALANTAEFDRRHLRSAGAWLFGRRPVRPVRPARRIVSVLLAAAWLSLLARAFPLLQVFLLAAVVAWALTLAALAVWPRVASKLKGKRKRDA